MRFSFPAPTRALSRRSRRTSRPSHTGPRAWCRPVCPARRPCASGRAARSRFPYRGPRTQAKTRPRACRSRRGRARRARAPRSRSRPCRPSRRRRACQKRQDVRSQGRRRRPRHLPPVRRAGRRQPAGHARFPTLPARLRPPGLVAAVLSRMVPFLPVKRTSSQRPCRWSG